jgi:hypothetical protein
MQHQDARFEANGRLDFFRKQGLVRFQLSGIDFELGDPHDPLIMASLHAPLHWLGTGADQPDSTIAQ